MRPKRQVGVEDRRIVLPFAAPPDDLSWVRCVHCREALGLQQPDARLPERLLGICGPCALWFLIELVTERSEMILVQLPDGKSLRERAR
jgi:hypothetical protein